MAEVDHLASRFYSGLSPAGLSEHQVKEYRLWLRGEKQAAAGWR